MYYQVRWAGWGADYDAWREIDDLPRAQELVSEYELRMKQSEAALESSSSTSAVLELGVATAVEWRFANKKPSGRRGKPTVRCSYACAEPWTSMAVGSERQPPVVVAVQHECGSSVGLCAVSCVWPCAVCCYVVAVVCCCVDHCVCWLGGWCVFSGVGRWDLAVLASLVSEKRLSRF